MKIVFDKEYKIRALDPVKFEKGEALEKECSNFVEKISSFNEKVNTLVDILDLHANRIDSQKLRVRSRINWLIRSFTHSHYLIVIHMAYFRRLVFG